MEKVADVLPLICLGSTVFVGVIVLAFARMVHQEGKMIDLRRHLES